MDDWEAEYEEDRRRLMLGEDISLNRDRHDRPPTINFDEERVSDRPVTATAAPSQHSPMGGLGPNMTNPTPLPSVSSSWTSPSKRVETENLVSCRITQDNVEDDLRDVYAEYMDDPLPPHQVSDGACNHQESMRDTRFDLPYISLERNMSSLFGSKIGRYLFFSEVIMTTFKGFFLGKESLVACFVTPNCLYIGDVTTGALIVCVDIQRLYEVHILDTLFLGLRTMNGLDLELQTKQHTQRLADILQKITTYWKVNVAVIRSDAQHAKKFRREMHLVDKKKYTWELVEDPRTGLRVVNISEEFAAAFAPIAPAILHWFGSVMQPVKDWKGSTKKQRRCAWVTATCIFTAKVEGPGRNGSGIKHCVAMQYMTELYVGPGGVLGIVAAAGPPQPTVLIVFNSEEEKNAVLFILQECHRYRNDGKLLKVTRVDDVERINEAGRRSTDTQPQKFLMRPRRELYEFLRSPSV